MVSGNTLNINNLTMKNGHCGGSCNDASGGLSQNGGAIFNDGSVDGEISLSLINVILWGNSASPGGGGDAE